MKTKKTSRWSEYIEGPEEFRRFDEGVKQLPSVSHSALALRERAYKKKSLANLHRRGPKRKVS
jgi:hypothetical protein